MSPAKEALGADSEQKAPYRVLQETPGCDHCQCGAQFMVVFIDEEGDECATGTSYGVRGCA